MRGGSVAMGRAGLRKRETRLEYRQVGLDVELVYTCTRDEWVPTSERYPAASEPPESDTSVLVTYCRVVRRERFCFRQAARTALSRSRSRSASASPSSPSQSRSRSRSPSTTPKETATTATTRRRTATCARFWSSFRIRRRCCSSSDSVRLCPGNSPLKSHPCQHA